MVGWAEMPRSPGHVFYDRLQSVLIEGGFDGICRGGLSVLLRGQAGGAFELPLGALIDGACTWWIADFDGHPTLSAGWNGAARIQHCQATG